MKVSVVMAVYNASDYIYKTVESVIQQSFKDWELIAVDDCSTDNTLSILRSFEDDRICIIKKEYNSGAAESRNIGIRQAKGEYIAILDADDICYPDRLERQVLFLDNNSEISIVGGNAKAIDENGEYLYDINLPQHPDELKTRLLFESAMIQSSAMCRKDIFEKYQLFYDREFTYVEDFEFFQRASLFVDIANIPFVLVKYRVTQGNISNKYYSQQSRLGIDAIKKHFKSLEIVASESQLETLYSLLYQYHRLNRQDRIDFVRLFYVIYIRLSELNNYSTAVLKSYFIRFHKLACAGKFGYFNIIISLFDLFPVLKNTFFSKPIHAIRFALFFKMSIFEIVFSKLLKLK